MATPAARARLVTGPRAANVATVRELPSQDTLPTDKKPSRQAISGFLKSLRDAGILEVVREGKGRQPQILMFTKLVHLCE